MLAVAVVAATVEQHGRQAAFLHQVEHVIIASQKIGIIEAHLTKAIVHMRVGSGYPKGQGRIKFFDGGRESGLELIEVICACNVAWKRHIQAARDFLRGIVFANMNAVGEDALVFGEDGVIRVPLMCIGINDYDTPFGLRAVQVANGNSHIIQNSITLAAFGERVVGTAGQVARNSIDKGGVHRRNCPSDLESRAGKQLLSAG